jgi:uncharacterized RDD family membrane protein YckC
LLIAASPTWAIENDENASPPPAAEAEATSSADQPEGASDKDHSYGRERPREIVRIGGHVEVGADEEASSVVLVFGSAVIDGPVRGDVVAVGGSVRINSLVEGDVVVPLGSLELGPQAVVRGDAMVILGGLIADPEAKIEGERFELSMSAVEKELPALAGLKRWLLQGLLLGRPLPHQAGWWWWFALACAVLYLLTTVIFTRSIGASVKVLELRPVGSFFMGLLVFLLYGPLLLLLAATGVGLLVVPFLLCAVAIAFIFGKVAVYQYVGRQLGRQLRAGVLEIPLVAVLAGIVMLYLVYMIPVVGLLVWCAIALLGTGAVVFAFFGAFHSERPASNPALTQSYSPVTASEAAIGLPPLIQGQTALPPVVEAASLPRVGFWMRFGATLIDLLLVGALMAIIRHGSWFLPIWVIYHVSMWAWRGTTIGGVVFGLKIVRADGRPIDFAIALVRSLSSFLSAIALFLGFFWAGWTREKRAWHDLIAGTAVVKVPRGVSLL